jgi:hypothetical protein
VVQDHDPLAEIHDYLHVVLNEKNANPLIADPPNEIHELGRFFKSQTRGGFVEKEEVGSEGKRTGNFETLLKTEGKIFCHLFSIGPESGTLNERMNLLEDLRLLKRSCGPPEGRIETMSEGH